MIRLCAGVLACLIASAALAKTVPVEKNQPLNDQRLQAQANEEEDQELAGLDAGPPEGEDEADYD